MTTVNHTDAELEKRKKLVLEYGRKLEEMTCHRCKDVRNCEFAYDLYNTDEDCVWFK